MPPIKIGIVGAVSRGRSFRKACEATGRLKVEVVCDTDWANLEKARAFFGARQKFTDFGELLEKANVQAVIIATPMQLHAPMAIAALQRDIHVLSEVTAAVSIDECRRLVRAARRSRGIYMMAENYTYSKPNTVVRRLVEQGLFGEVYYAEGEYLHELKELNEKTPWRRRWQTGINGVTYGTHSLGPILQWFAGDRLTAVSCAGSDHHYRDPRGAFYENEDTCVMLGKFRGGGLVKIRVDMLSDRPHAMTNYQLQGTRGSYESARGPGERNKIWLRDLHGDPDRWQVLEDLYAEYLPEFWRNTSQDAINAGHGGGDFFEILDFSEAIDGIRPLTIGIHEAMDMTLPGLVSQESIAAGGAWLPVPDSRDW